MLGPPPMSSQAFVFRHCPTRKMPVEVTQRGIKCRLVITTVVVDPTAYHRVEHPCQIVDPSVHATSQLPATDFLSDRFGCTVADSRTKVHEVLTPSIFRSPGSKGITQEIELLVSVSPPTIIVLAIDDVRLIRVEFQTTFSKALLQLVLQNPRLMLGVAVAQ